MHKRIKLIVVTIISIISYLVVRKINSINIVDMEILDKILKVTIISLVVIIYVVALYIVSTNLIKKYLINYSIRISHHELSEMKNIKIIKYKILENGVIEMVFKSMGVPKVSWNENSELVESVINHEIFEIDNYKGQLDMIVIKSKQSGVSKDGKRLREQI